MTKRVSAGFNPGSRRSFRVDAYPDDKFSGTVAPVRLEPTHLDAAARASQARRRRRRRLHGAGTSRRFAVQEMITLSVFVPFALFYMRQPLNWTFVWAGLCLLGAVYFMFR